MYVLKLVVIIFGFYVCSVYAATVNCTPKSSSEGHNYDKWSDIHVPFELKPSTLTMTLGGNIPDWTVLYTASNTDVGMSATTCSGGYYGMYYTILDNASLVGTIGKDYIYSTDTPGVGISISSDANGGASLQAYPSSIYHGSGTLGQGFWATVKYWKIPGVLPMNNGPITVTGPDVAVIYMYSGNVFESDDTARIIDNGNAYISSSRILTLTMLFLPGTCNIEGDNVHVELGDYDGADGHSEWKDASFKLVCPNGMGYNGASNSGNGYDYPYSIASGSKITNNNKVNGKVEISIIPLNSVEIDASRGIIALDGTGAQGYGIQLAWGDYSTQNATEPANPVILNSYVDANSLNSAFRSGDTPIGQNAFTGGDNTIKMAARYIRTSGDTAPGPANAVVQVIANYQ